MSAERNGEEIQHHVDDSDHGQATDESRSGAMAAPWRGTICLQDLVERTRQDPGAFFRNEDIEKNLAAAWRLQQDDLAALITLRKRLGDADCPLRKFDKALRKFDQEMRSDYSRRAGTRAKAGEALPGQLTLDDFMAFMPDHRYIHLPTGILWPAASVNARLPSVDVGAEKPIAASLWLAQNRHCEQMTWAPGYPSVIHDMAILDGGF